VKRTLKCRHYVRYVDDIVLLVRDREVAGAVVRGHGFTRLAGAMGPSQELPNPSSDGGVPDGRARS
jgi:hypothetical protein